MSNFYPVMFIILSIISFGFLVAAVKNLFEKSVSLFLFYFLFFGMFVAATLWFVHQGREDEYQNFKQNESEHENTDDLSRFQELLPKVGDKLDVHFLTRHEDSVGNTTYNIGYKANDGQLQWMEIQPTKKANTFDDLGKTGVIRIILDEKREKSEFVREKNKIAHFIMSDGEETQAAYPVYVLYVSSKTGLQSSTKTMTNGKLTKTVEEDIVVNP